MWGRASSLRPIFNRLPSNEAKAERPIEIGLQAEHRLICSFQIGSEIHSTKM